MKSVFGKLNWSEFLKGLYVAVSGGVVGFLAPILQNLKDCLTNTPGADCFNLIVFDWTSVWHIAVGAAISYLMLTWASNSKGKPLTKEPNQ